jgi:CheY-like chemotaxis protein
MNILDHEAPDLILLDINMPVMSGYECMKEIKKLKLNAKIIAQTAYAMPDEKEKCLNAGCHGYIAKPIDKKELLDTIEQVMHSDG